MTKARIVLSFALALPALLVGSTVALAQTCASPIVLTQGGSGSDNTCASPTGTGANTIGTYCGAIASPENEIIYSVHLGAGATGSFSITNVQAGFNPAIVLFQASDATTCLVASNCIGLPSDANGAGGDETLSFNGDAAGDYYVAVTGEPGTGSCGSYDWGATATLPVKLEKFSVQ